MDNDTTNLMNVSDRKPTIVRWVLPAIGLLALATSAQAQQVTYPVAAAMPAQTVPATTYVTTAPAATYVASPATTYSSGYATPVYTQPAGGDAYGFTSWLNGTRAQYGLAPVSFDSNLASWAASNNAQQAARGLGHFVMGPSRRQNSAIGNAASIGYQWMQSPAHRALLLDPTIRFIGLAGNGQYWTLNAR